MKYAALLLLVAGAVQAQGFSDSPTCYSWNGGHKSAGSFSKCNTDLQAVYIPPPKPEPVVVAPVAAPAPVVTQIIQAPQQTCAPPPKPILRVKPKPRPKVTC